MKSVKGYARKKYIIMKRIIKKWRKNKTFDKCVQKTFRIVKKVDNLMFILLYLREMLLYNNNVMKKYPVKSTIDYCIEKGYHYIIIEEERERQVCKPSYFELCEEEVITKKSPQIYIAELENIKVVGSNSYLIGDNYCLYDLITYDGANRYDLRFESLIKINNKEAVIAEKKNLIISEIIPKAICLVGVAAYNYYHITVEILSRLIYLDTIQEYRKLPIIVDSVVREIPQFIGLLDLINEYNHPIIYLGDRKYIQVQKLIYPSNNTWMPVNLRKHEAMKPEDFLLSSLAIWNIRTNVLMGIDLNKMNVNKKIFISRRNNKTRRLVNEEKIAALFVSHGFEIMYPEELSFKEQIQIYAQTKCFACTTGAALTNIIYASNDAHIICIIPKQYEFCLYSTIAYILGQKCTFLDAEVVEKNETLSNDDFILNEEQCERFLNTLEENNRR